MTDSIAQHSMVSGLMTMCVPAASLSLNMCCVRRQTPPHPPETPPMHTALAPPAHLDFVCLAPNGSNVDLQSLLETTLALLSNNNLRVWMCVCARSKGCRDTGRTDIWKEGKRLCALFGSHELSSAMLRQVAPVALHPNPSTTDIHTLLAATHTCLLIATSPPQTPRLHLHQKGEGRGNTQPQRDTHHSSPRPNCRCVQQHTCRLSAASSSSLSPLPSRAASSCSASTRPSSASSRPRSR